MEYRRLDCIFYLNLITTCHYLITFWGYKDAQNVHNVRKNKDFGIYMNSVSIEYMLRVSSDRVSEVEFCSIDTRVDAWKEYIDFNCTIHTERQCWLSRRPNVSINTSVKIQ